MVGNKGRDTQPEIMVRSALHAMGLRFRKNARPLPGLRCTADVVFRRERVAVFIDGCFWHGCPEHGRVPATNNSYWSEKLERNALRDRRNTRALEEAGWAVLRYWEHQPIEEVAVDIRDQVLGRRGAN
jgi:DNA mismatch endonuclease (patch repair protein)